jgi:hypothetical protein
LPRGDCSEGQQISQAVYLEVEKTGRTTISIDWCGATRKWQRENLAGHTAFSCLTRMRRRRFIKYLKPVQIKTACLQPEKVVLCGVRRPVAALQTIRLIYAQASSISL